MLLRSVCAILFAGLLMTASLSDVAIADGAKAEGRSAEILFQGKDVIWGFEFVDSNTVLITERSGLLRLIHLPTKKVTEYKLDLPIAVQGQGGLLDIRKHPNFERNKWIYLTYSQSKGDLSTTALARFEFTNEKITNLKTLFSAKALSSNEIHYGSRLAFQDNKTLL